MIQFLKNSLIVGLIILVSGLGVGLGKNLGDQHALLGLESLTSLAKTESKNDRYENLELFNRVLHFVEANYVDEVENKKLIEGAIKGMLETLDPHSTFLSSDLFKDMQIDTSGKFGGLGIEIGMKDNILTILAPIEDTPAWKAGLKPNDRIVKIDGESTKGMSLVEAVTKMRGKAKTPVTLTIYRQSFEKLRDIKIVRDIIRIVAVKSEELEPQYGYARVTTFNENVARDLRKAIQKMQNKDKLRGLVLDLRYNPGGLLDQAVDVASLFIDEGPIVSTIGRNRDQKDVKHATKGDTFDQFPIAVLVNSSTASAAEIVAGALQDHQRAIVMGQDTFGKGSVQTVIPLPPDMGLKLTIARYYTPSGRSIQEQGVKPDIYLEEFDPKLLKKAKLSIEGFREKDLKGHMVNQDIKHDDFEKEELDALSSNGTTKKKKTEDEDEDEMSPYRLNPKEDYQVKQALISLKSYRVYQKSEESSDSTAKEPKKDQKDS